MPLHPIAPDIAHMMTRLAQGRPALEESPLPTLRKALPGYKCLHPLCVQALRPESPTTVSCPLGHVFPREAPGPLLTAVQCGTTALACPWCGEMAS